MSEGWADDRFRRLNSWFTNPLLEPSFLFNSATITMFTNFNRLLQREEPTIHLLNEGTISEAQFETFHTGGQSYFKKALQYIQNKFPLKDEVICNSVWIDVEKRLDSKWESVHFFCEKYQNLSIMKKVNLDELYDEFLDYQALSDREIFDSAWTEAKMIDSKADDGNVYHYRMDVLWYHIAQIKLPDTSINRFKHLPLVAEIVLIIPHSNSGQERLFSIVRKNKTDSRSSLKLDGSLSSILATKCQNPESVTPCFKWRPEEEILQKSSRSTYTYNQKHQ